MRTPAQIKGHPIHPMLVTIPIGLWVFSLVCDLIALGSDNADTWHTVALYTMIGGIVGALLAALPGLVDALSLRDHAIRKTAFTHMAINLTVVALYAFNAWLRITASMPTELALGLSVLAIALLLVSGWLGGKMVYLARVAVSEGDAAAPADEAWHRQQAHAMRRDSGRAFTPRPGMAPDRAMASDKAQRDTDRS